MTPQAFIEKWSRTELRERQASQEHFIDLCRLLGQKSPAEDDPTGERFCFEKGTPGVSGSAGSKGKHGFADVWKRGHFAWEYKGKDQHKDLDGAYRQLCQYREALENPPLLIVSDIDRIEIHTNFTGTVKRSHAILLKDLGEPEAQRLLRAVFEDPASLKPVETPARVTEEVAARFASIAQTLQKRVKDPQVVAHFLMQCMFALFAEDVRLLPKDLFKRTLEAFQDKPKDLTAVLTDLFAKMAKGGTFGADRIAHFNGGLFDAAPALELTRDEIGIMLLAAKQDWANVEPAIFGTLFERSLDPQKRSQIGAHYTSRDDIMLVIEPVIMEPLRREWGSVRAQAEVELARQRKVKTERASERAQERLESLLAGFLLKVGRLRVLDPACGSGNFLYVALQQLLNLEKDVIAFGARPDVGASLLPNVLPTQLHGIEISPYAVELAQVAIWIGYLQWMRDNGFLGPRDPVLEPLKTIECRDAIVDLSDPAKPRPASWPEADFIVGNPPFLGRGFLQRELGAAYTIAMRDVYGTHLADGADLCCYWFELARREVRRSASLRVGLLATQAIRGGSNRAVLDAICADASIFMAWSDREWMLDGAAVHISIIGFAKSTHGGSVLDGAAVTQIHPDLTSGVDTTSVSVLCSQENISFQGTINCGPMDVAADQARTWLGKRSVAGQPLTQVLQPWTNAMDLTRRPRGRWIINFGNDMTEAAASQYDDPFDYLLREVRPWRDKTSYAPSSDYPFWQLWRPRREYFAAARGCNRILITPRVAKHRLFRWFPDSICPDSATIAFARDDDYFFGVLHSSVHELWALRQGTQLEDRPRYTPTTCFETFPLPWPPGSEPTSNQLYRSIASAANDLDQQRERWLNPPEWIAPIAKRIDAADDFSDVPTEARAMIRQSAIMAEAAKDPNLKKRTLTNLYNERPPWLQFAHEKLDQAVLEAYAAVDPSGKWDQAWAEVWRETGAGQQLPAGHPLEARRAEVDQKVLSALLRLNQERAGVTTPVAPSATERAPTAPRGKKKARRT